MRFGQRVATMTRTRWVLLAPLALFLAVLLGPSGTVYQVSGAIAAQRAALCGPSGCDGGVIVHGPAGGHSPIGAVAVLGLIVVAAASTGVGLGRRALAALFIGLGAAMLVATTTDGEAVALAARLDLRGRLDAEIAPMWHYGAALGLLAYGVAVGLSTTKPPTRAR